MRIAAKDEDGVRRALLRARGRAARVATIAAIAAVALPARAEGTPASPAPAEETSLLRSENANVREGNEKLRAGDHEAALAAYDRAARELPAEGGVHLNRGLSLLAAGELDAARDALRLSTRPPASTRVRSDGYYNLGIAFYQAADAQAAEQAHEQAQAGFREAADAFKQALRLRPGDRDAAWNYELAVRRIREQEQKQEQKEQQEKEQQENEQQQEQRADNEPRDQQEQAPGEEDPQPDDPSGEQERAERPEQEPPQQPPEQAPDQPEPDSQPASDPETQQAEAHDLPRPEIERALDALQESEQSFERIRAMQRAARERRRPEKDW